MVSQNEPIKPKGSCSQSLSCTGLLLGIPILTIVILLLFWISGRFLVVADPLTPADTVIPLGGAEDSSRLEQAAQIYKDGFAHWIILTETGEVYPKTNTPLTSIYRKELEKMGVPEDAIRITEKIASSTWGEARVVRKLMLREGFQSCIVVTDPYHTRRTKIVFGDEFSPHGLDLIVRPTRTSWYRPSTWWMQKAGWNVVLSEYSKLLAYFFGFRQN